MRKTNSIDVHVRDATSGDAGRIAEIYNYYVLNTAVTFEENTISSSEMESRMGGIRDSCLPWLIGECGGSVVGYSYASRWRTREAYRFSAESTVYVDPRYRRMGVGSVLYAAVLAKLEVCGLHAAIGGIALPNEASIALHERFGFKKVAHFEQVGFKFDRWIDVGYWQRLLSRS